LSDRPPSFITGQSQTSVQWIVPSLLAYAALQLAQMKAGKNNDSDFDDKPISPSLNIAAAPNQKTTTNHNHNGLDEDEAVFVDNNDADDNTKDQVKVLPPHPASRCFAQ